MQKAEFFVLINTHSVLPERDLPHVPPLPDELPPPIACGGAREGLEGGHGAWGLEYLCSAS